MPGLREPLAGAPGDERSLLELRATGRSLPEAHARVAARLRVFVLNWDPLGWLGGACDVHRSLGDPDRAEQEFRHAAVLVEAQGDQQDAAIVTERLSALLATLPERESDAAEAALIAKRALAAERGQRIASKIGRNDPCPCGSGRKHKKCCGA